MCGIAGVVAETPVNQMLYDALILLQHRGQDAAGIATAEGKQLRLEKEAGLVRDVFNVDNMTHLEGRMGIAHCRYPTAGTYGSAEAQPMYVNSPYGITMAHNGNLTNAAELRASLYETDLRHINTRSDSEVLLNIFAHELQRRRQLKATPADFFAAVDGVHRRCRGGYSVVALIVGHGVLAFRDPHGIRPLIYGQRESDSGRMEYMVASESVVLDVLGFEVVRDLHPGEALFISEQGELHSRICGEPGDLTPCMFEFVYFARTDSIIDGISVYKSRLRQGEKLAQRILAEWPSHDIDVVIPIPDTGRTAALPLAHQLNVKYREGLVKNPYIGRTFIMPGQEARAASVRHKHNPIGLEFRGKNVLLVDDSIVRGTTCQRIVKMAREAGARKVYYASTSPPVKYPHVYGIDMPAPEEFVAHNRTEEEIAKIIGADRLIYQRLDDLVACATEGNPSVTRFETSVFDGRYVTGDEAVYLDEVRRARNDAAKETAPRPAPAAARK